MGGGGALPERNTFVTFVTCKMVVACKIFVFKGHKNRPEKHRVVYPIIIYYYWDELYKQSSCQSQVIKI